VPCSWLWVLVSCLQQHTRKKCLGTSQKLSSLYGVRGPNSSPCALPCRHKPLAAAVERWSWSLCREGGGALQRNLVRGVQQRLELAGSRGGLQAAGLWASPVSTHRSPSQPWERPCLAGGAELPGNRESAPGVPAERDGSRAVQSGLGSQRGVHREGR